ncbi:MAG: SPOR domain-containing protein [Thermodesulfobacteriota bacterium]
MQPKEEFGLLAGSFRSYAGASKMLEKLKKQEQEAFIRRDRRKFQVWVGPFSTPGEAQAAAKALNKKIKISGKVHKLVTPVPK